MINYFKKFSIMFAMSLVLMLGYCANVLAVDNGVVGTNNLNNTVENSAKLGNKLISPEKGWKRYDDSNGNIKYDGWHWKTTTNSGGYSGSEHYTGVWGANGDSEKGESVNFNFYGTKLRLISLISNSYITKDISVKIDGNIYPATQFFGPTTSICLFFEAKDLPLKEHSVSVVNNTNVEIFFDAIDIDSTGMLKLYNENPLIQVSNISLNKPTDSLQVEQMDTLVATITPDNAINKNITWNSSDSSIGTVDSNGKVTAIKEGQATITVTTADGSNLSATCILTVTSKPVVVPPTQTTSSAVVLNIEPEKPQIHLKETVSANLTIDNIKEIAAEDVRIKYDNTRLKFLSMNEIDGIKLVKSEQNDGELRIIVASQGTGNVVNAKKVLLKLKFQGIASGDALVDVTKGKVSDGITMEKDLTDAECGQAIIKIDDTMLTDVNNNGEFTLLDLAIDARHLGENPATLTEYNTDQVINGAIDNDDLTKIGEYMLANPNYKFN